MFLWVKRKDPFVRAHLSPVLQKFTQQAGGDGAEEGAKEGDRDGVAQCFGFTGGKVDGGDVKDGLARTRYAGGAARDVAVHAVAGYDVLEQGYRATSGEGDEHHELRDLLWYAEV